MFPDYLSVSCYYVETECSENTLIWWFGSIESITSFVYITKCSKLQKGYVRWFFLKETFQIKKLSKIYRSTNRPTKYINLCYLLLEKVTKNVSLTHFHCPKFHDIKKSQSTR